MIQSIYLKKWSNLYLIHQRKVYQNYYYRHSMFLNLYLHLCDGIHNISLDCWSQISHPSSSVHYMQCIENNVRGNSNLVLASPNPSERWCFYIFYIVLNTTIWNIQIDSISGQNFEKHTRLFFEKHTFKKHEVQNAKKLRNV